MKVIAINANKGGVGKTTTSLGLGVGLARGGHGRVLIIDFDAQGHVAKGLGVTFEDRHNVAELFVPKPPPLVPCPTNIPNLDVLPTDLRLKDGAEWLMSQDFREYVLADALAPLAANYQWAVIDCQPQLGSLVTNAFVAADHVLIPCRAEARAIDGVVGTFDQVGTVAQRVRRPDLYHSVRILRTIRDERERTANADLDRGLAEYRPHLFNTIIPVCSDLNHAQRDRQDFFLHNPRSRGAVAYQQLVDEVVTLWAARESVTT